MGRQAGSEAAGWRIAQLAGVPVLNFLAMCAIAVFGFITYVRPTTWYATDQGEQGLACCLGRPCKDWGGPEMHATN